ncbi:MAG TPA: hypothetical protein VMF66_07550 [Candidatus Acidoferrum sp.]|nr:hypothetical protein [Candidatus Acidoferrum sp.]
MPFPKHGHHKTFVCNHVFEKRKPILFVSRPDGHWLFLCGAAHPNVASSFKLVGIAHLLQQDPSLEELADLPVDWDAERETAEGEWLRTPYDLSKAPPVA